MHRYALLGKVIEEFCVKVNFAENIQGFCIFDGYNGLGAVFLFEEDGIFMSFQAAIVEDIVVLFHSKYRIQESGAGSQNTGVRG